MKEKKVAVIVYCTIEQRNTIKSNADKVKRSVSNYLLTKGLE